VCSCSAVPGEIRRSAREDRRVRACPPPDPGGLRAPRSGVGGLQVRLARRRRANTGHDGISAGWHVAVYVCEILAATKLWQQRSIGVAGEFGPAWNIGVRRTRAPAGHRLPSGQKGKAAGRPAARGADAAIGA
jgi:hypothetical protein